MKAFSFNVDIKGENFLVEYRTDRSAVRFTSSSRDKKGYLPLKDEESINTEEDMKSFVDSVVSSQNIDKLVWM